MLKMKILVICQFYYPENFVISKIAEQFVKEGHDVSVLTGLPNYGYGYIIPEYKNTRFEIINGVKVYRVKLVARSKSRFSIIRNYLSFWRNSKRWIRKHIKEDFDLVYSMSLSPVTILAPGNLYKKKRKVPHVVHCVDLWPESVLITHAVSRHSPMYSILYKWSKKLYSAADYICIGSPSFEEYFHNVLNITHIPIEYVPQPSLIEDISQYETYRFGEGFHIVYCGNIGQIQMVEKLPEAFSLLKNKNIYMHIIGMGPKSEHLTEEIKKYGVEKNVIYHGPLTADKAAPFLKGCDALYVSLKADGYVGKTIPNKLMLYMTFAKPILACLEGDGKDELIKTRGALFCQDNPDSIRQSVERLTALEQPILKQMGELNQSYYFKYFSLKSVSNRLLTIFDQIQKRH